MTHSFVAYIDESGDDGLKGRFRQPGAGGGPSHWFVIGATVWRLSRDLDMVNCAKDIIQRLPERKRKKPLHFTELDHAQRVMAITQLVNKPFRASGVFAYKPLMRDDVYVSKNQLYHYMTRYLIERLSWLCRDHRKSVPEGDGRIKIVFSRRGGMDYEDFQQYLRHLQGVKNSDIKINWSVIDIDGVEAQDNGRRYGLQLADIVIGGLRSALEPDLYGNVEPRFMEMLKPHVYHRNGNYLSYGAKLVPTLEQILACDRDDVAPVDLTHWQKFFR